MSKDIVERLQDVDKARGLEAAHEIERLRKRIADLERRCDVPALLREAEAFCVTVYRDTSMRVEIHGAVPHSMNTKAWNNAQPLIDFIDQHSKPPLSELLYDGAMVRLRNGDECRISDNGNEFWPWKCGAMSWNSQGQFYQAVSSE